MSGSRRLVLASDHGGFALKEDLKAWLRGEGYDIIDVGTHSTASCDYPVFAAKAARVIASGEAWRGVVIDGAGIGSAMAANKVPGVRAGMAFDERTARNAAEHNGAHLVTLGAGYLDPPAARRIVHAFLSTECTVDRHRRRVGLIDSLDGVTRSEPNVAASTDQALVDRIVQVLDKHPQLLAQVASTFVAAGAPGNVCTTCNTCTGNCAASSPDAVRGLLKIAGRGRVRGRLGVRGVPKDIAKLIDHTLLKPQASYSQVEQLCSEAREYGFASVCVNPVHVKRCAQNLRGSGVLVCTVIGFPLGATPKEVKALEARRALRDGASELDMVLNIGALKSGDHQTVFDDIRLVREVAHEGRAKLKVIIETALLSDEEKVTACVLAKRARADFVKTSTGFSKGGATAHDVALMARAVNHQLEVKASGGVRNLDDANKMVAAGATRIGASMGIAIAIEAKGEKVESTSGSGY